MDVKIKIENIALSWGKEPVLRGVSLDIYKNMIKGNALIGQSGGPTSVINSSLAGVIETAMSSSLIENIYGMQMGIEGFMQELIYDLGNQPRKII